MQELHALDQDGKQRIPNCFTRQWVLLEILRLRSRRISRSDSSGAVGREILAALSIHMRRSRSGIVPIREARMQRQEPHPLDQYGNQWIPQWFTRRWAAQDIPKLQPMGVALSDSGAELNIPTLSYARLCSLDRHPDGGLRIIRTLRRHESYRLKQIEFGYCCYWAHVLQSLDSGAVPTYDARQSRKRLLNAPRRRDDNSQCSELREWERHNWYLFSMALMVLGMNQSGSNLRRLSCL